MEIRRTKILGFTLLLAGLALCATGLWLLLSPAQYRAIVKIRVALDYISNLEDVRNSTAAVYDPNFIVSTAEIIQSEAVLTNVVLALNLNDVWGKKYAGGNKLKTSRTVKWLKKRIKIQTVPRQYSFSMKISTTSVAPNKAAKIANAVAEAYQHYRDEQKRQLFLNGIKVLEETFKQEEQEIKTQREMVKQLKGKIPEPIPELPSPAMTLNPLPDKTNQKPLDTNAVSYFEAARKLATKEEFHKLLADKIEAEKYPRVLNSEVQIEELAALPQTPVGPNRRLGAVSLLAGLAMSLWGFRLVGLSAHQPS
jgi:uncharacterized protein involved in exopolysaccharide biosynthesis